jgi:hypothetical protein
MPFLDFSDQLELMKAGVEINTIGTYSAGRGFRQVKKVAAQRPAAMRQRNGYLATSPEFDADIR